jgi:AraC-like DNA-binding protein
MDAVAALLSGPRAQRAFVLRSRLRSPWSLRVEDRAPLTVVVVVTGTAWLLPAAADRVQMATGDLAIVRGPDPYTVADDPGTAPQALIHPDQTCTAVDGGTLEWQSGTGIHTWGNVGPEAGRPDADETVLLTGTYGGEGEVSRRLLSALPPVLVLPYRDEAVLVDLLVAETCRDRPGQEAVLDRLLDVVLVSMLRSWFDRPEALPPGWYQATQDPIVGPALQLLQHHPDRPWTVASLAAEVGLSRAALARRFTQLVGEPPMTFLTGWRLALAADLLADTTDTVEQVARQVGYGNAFALSAAFRRTYGASPREHRTRTRAG